MVVAIAAAGYIVTENTKKKLQENLINNFGNEELSESLKLVKLFKTEIEGTEEKLKLIAQMPDVKNHTENCNAKLQESITILDGKIGNLGRVSKDGNFACSLNKALIGTKAASLGAYMDDIFNDPAHRTVMSRAIKPPGSDSYIIAIHIPVYDDNGEFNGTLGGAFYLNNLQEKYLKDSVIAKNGFASLVDDDGTILFHQEQDFIGRNYKSEYVQAKTGGSASLNEFLSKGISGQSGVARYTYANEERIGGYSPLILSPTRTWSVFVIVPTTSAQENIKTIGIDNLFIQLLLTNLIILFIIITILWIFAQQGIFTPLSKLKQFAEQLGNGNYTTRINMSGNDELGQLAQAFNTMADKLENSHKELEEKVNTRTKELSEGMEVEKSKADKAMTESEEIKRLNQVMIGRELKMSELKVEIESLKEQLARKT